MVDLHGDDLVRGLPWLKPAAACLGALLLVAGLSAWGGYMWGARANAGKEQRAEAAAQRQKGRADAAEEREAQAKAEKAVAQQVAEERGREVARLRAERDALPADPGPQPVPGDAPLQLVVGGLRGLGLAPSVLGGDPTLGLSLADGRTALDWGLEARRVPILRARLQATEALSDAQESQIDALQERGRAGDEALEACDEGRLAERARADALEESLLRKPLDRPWAAGMLVGLDTTGARRLGAYVGWGFGRVHVNATVVGNVAAIGGGIRF